MGPGGSWCRCGRRGRSGCQAGPRGPAREIVRRIVALRGPAKNRRDSTWVPVIILVISSGANALGWIPFKVDIRSGVRREFAGAVRIKCPYVADFEQEHRTLPGGAVPAADAGKCSQVCFADTWRRHTMSCFQRFTPSRSLCSNPDVPMLWS